MPKTIKIPKAIREQTWIRYNGVKFTAKCYVAWCVNRITPFTFEVGHNIPSSKGGETVIDNLRPICSSCNRSMGNKYTIDEFSKLSKPVTVKELEKTDNKRMYLRCMCSCFKPSSTRSRNSDNDTNNNEGTPG